MFKNEPDWLKRYREDARENFNKLDLDVSRYTKLRVNFDEVIKTGNATAVPDKIKDLMKDDTRIIIVQLNSRIIHTNIPEHVRKKGFVLESFEDSLIKHPDMLKKFYQNRALKSGESKLVAFNAANFSSGIFMHVPKGIVLEEPVYYFLAITGGENVISQVSIISEEGSKATFVEEDYSFGQDNSFHSANIEAQVGESANLIYVNMQKFGENVTSITNKKAVADRDSTMKWVVGRLGSKLNKAKRDTMLVGEGASVEDIEIFLGDNSQHFDITSNIHHAVPNTKGNVLVKGVLKGKARSVSQGLIKVEKNAQKTDSFLAEHTMLLDPRARSDAIPGLEIEANDVRCTHSASVSQVDEEQVFYLKARGIEEREAKKLIVLGFLGAAFDKIQAGEISEKFHRMVEDKWDAKGVDA